MAVKSDACCNNSNGKSIMSGFLSFKDSPQYLKSNQRKDKIRFVLG